LSKGYGCAINPNSHETVTVLEQTIDGSTSLPWRWLVVSCTGNGLPFGDLSDPGSEVSRLIEDTDGSVLNPEMGTRQSRYY